MFCFLHFFSNFMSLELILYVFAKTCYFRSLALLVSTLQKKGIQLVAVDFDQTFITDTKSNVSAALVPTLMSMLLWCQV